MLDTKSIKKDFDKIKDQAVKENVKITLPAFMPVNINEKE